MALLDVSLDTLLDPMLTDSFTVKRRPEFIAGTGRSSTTDTILPNIIGVVTMASGKDLERLPDDEVFERVISVVTSFALQGETQGAQPDVVVWRGNNYVVRAIDLYPQFGGGFIQAICTSMDLVDSAFAASLAGKALQFNNVTDSAYLGVI